MAPENLKIVNMTYWSECPQYTEETAKGRSVTDISCMDPAWALVPPRPSALAGKVLFPFVFMQPKTKLKLRWKQHKLYAMAREW